MRYDIESSLKRKTPSLRYYLTPQNSFAAYIFRLDIDTALTGLFSRNQIRKLQYVATSSERGKLQEYCGFSAAGYEDDIS